jgi:hypothetical protein
MASFTFERHVEALIKGISTESERRAAANG